MEVDQICISFLFVNCLCLGFAYPNFIKNHKLEIVGGNVTDISEVPYQVAVLTKDKWLLCGGSIISKNFILTAGHCCLDYEPLIFRAGSNLFDSGGTLLYSKKIVIHPKFSVERYPDYDICLVEVKKPIKFSKTIKPIKVGYKRPRPDTITRVAGWGLTDEDGDLSRQLLSVNVPITNTSYCENAYPFVDSFDRMVCAGIKGKDSCNGDSGGALTWKNQVIGTVSFGNGCGRDGDPGVYASVTNPEMRSFIKKVAGV